MASRKAKRGPVRFPSVRWPVLVMLLAIVSYITVSSLAFATGPSYFGDDVAYAWFANALVHGGHFAQSPTDVLTIRVLQFYPIAFFYWLFGANIMSSVAWDVVSFAGTTVIIFLIGRELYSDYAGIVAALLFAFLPAVVRLAWTMSDSLPVMFLASLAMLALLYGTRGRSRLWYSVCGAALVASTLVMPMGLMALAIVLLYIIVEALRGRLKPYSRLLYLAYGLAIALALTFAFNYLSSSSHNPFITYTETFSYFQGSHTQLVPANAYLGFYIQVMFPSGLVNALSNAARSGNASLLSFWGQIYSIGSNTVGFYFYFLIIAMAVLAARVERRSYFLFFWFVIGFLVMEFDPFHVSLSPFVYMLQHRLDRYITFVAPPAVLLISMAGFSLADKVSKRRRHRALKRALAAGVFSTAVIFLVATAVPISMYWNQLMYAQRYTQQEAAAYLLALPNSTRIYFTSAVSMAVIYMHFDNLSRFSVYDGIANCSQIGGPSYIILPEYNQVYGLNYTPAGSGSCTYWRQVPLNQLHGVPPGIASDAQFAQVSLYYVPAH